MRFVPASISALMLCFGAAVFAQELPGPVAPTPAAAAPVTAQAPAAQQAPAANSSAPAATPAPAATDAAPATRPATIVVPSGTRLPLVLHNAITTRNAHPGDPVYFETLFPIVLNDKIVIPAGSYVQGEITEAKRPGRVKGTGELRVRLDTMILPNGYTVHFGAVPTNAGTGGNESVDKEGTIHGDTDKADDAATVITDTGIGTAVGTIAGRSAEGAGIGAGVGAAVGLATVLLTRGPELELPRGTTLDVALDHPLTLDASRITFTDTGRAPELAGPPNREPVRTKNPIPF
jgi:hypothetical protein